MDSGGKKIEYICRVMALTYTETEKYHKISDAYHEVNEAKMWVESIHG